MKQEQNSFSISMDLLEPIAWKFALSIFLKILSVVMSVVEPLFWGLRLLSWQKISWIWQHLRELVLTPPISRSLWRSIYSVGSSMKLGSYTNYFMTNAVQKTVPDMRNDCPIKINHILLLWPASVRRFALGRFNTSDVETVSNALQQSFLTNLLMLFTAFVTIRSLYLNTQLGASGRFCPFRITYFSARFIMKIAAYLKSRHV